MRYYVVSDIHSYYTELEAALREKGFFDDPQPHKLIICGDLFDKGTEARKVQDFVTELMEKDAVILIQGNHESLVQQVLSGWHWGSYLNYSHHINGTMGTVFQLADCTMETINADPAKAIQDMVRTPYIDRIIPAMDNFYETEHYIFVHGWIPCTVTKENGHRHYEPIENWRVADYTRWNQARWINGMEAAHAGITVPGKTIVCGHWHCSFGHTHYENKGTEHGPNMDSSPYCAEGIIAIDACTSHSSRVNCIVIED